MCTGTNDTVKIRLPHMEKEKKDLIFVSSTVIVISMHLLNHTCTKVGTAIAATIFHVLLRTTFPSQLGSVCALQNPQHPA